MDSSDRSTIDDVRVCLDTLLLRGDLKGIPLLVFANKQDIKGAMTPEEVEDALHLHNIKDRLYRELYIAENPSLYSSNCRLYIIEFLFLFSSQML